MTEQTHTYRDSEFDINQAGNYTLLLQVNTESFAYAIVNGTKLMAISTNSELAELNNPKQLYEKLTANYKKTVITLPAKAFMLVPFSLFDTDRAAEFARLLDVKEDERVLAQVLDAENYVVYKVDDFLVNAIANYDIKKAVFAPKGWVRAIDQLNPTNTELYLNLENNKVEIAHFKRNKLRFYNQFNIESPEDLVYYTTFVSDELELKPQNVSLFLSGNVSQGDDNYRKLERYFSKVQINSSKVLELPSHIPSHQILSLSALSLCAL